MTKNTTKVNFDIHETVTAKLIGIMEAGAGDFVMPWHRQGSLLTMPKNAQTGNQYKGANVINCWISAEEKGFQHQQWATYKQWVELGGQVRKGEKGTLIIKYGTWTPKEAKASEPKQGADADNGERLYASPAWVFNVAQVDGVPQPEPAVKRDDLTERLAHVDEFLANTGAKFQEGGQRAYYRQPIPRRDTCNLSDPDHTDSGKRHRIYRQHGSAQHGNDKKHNAGRIFKAQTTCCDGHT